MSKYTKGPWKVYHKPLRPGMNKIIEVQDSEGSEVVPWSGFDACDFTDKTKLANAHLIAAAPELLEALKIAEIALVNCIPVIPYRGDGPLVKIRAAIAKAEGN